MAELSQDEFQRWMHLLRADIQEVNNRLDTLNGRTRTVENKVAVLEDRGVRDPVARWGSGLGYALVMALEVYRWITGK